MTSEIDLIELAEFNKIHHGKRHSFEKVPLSQNPVIGSLNKNKANTAFGGYVAETLDISIIFGNMVK